jgi:hypothetical protein
MLTLALTVIVLALGCNSIIKTDNRKGKSAENSTGPNNTEEVLTEPEDDASQTDPVTDSNEFQLELSKVLAANPEILVIPTSTKKIYGGVGQELELFFIYQRAFDLLEKDWLSKVTSYQFRSASLSKDFIRTANGSVLTTEQYAGPGVTYTSTETVEGDTKTRTNGTNGNNTSKSKTICSEGVCDFFSSSSFEAPFYKAGIESTTSKDGIKTYKYQTRTDESSDFIVNQFKTCREVNSEDCIPILSESRYITDTKDTRDICHFDQLGRNTACESTVLPINGSSVIESSIKTRNVYTDDEKAVITTIDRFKKRIMISKQISDNGPNIAT